MSEIKTSYITIQDACKYLSVSPATIYRWAGDGKITMYKVGGTATRLKMEDVEQLIKRIGMEDEQ